MAYRVRKTDAPNHLEQELGVLHGVKREQVTVVLKRFIANVRVVSALSSGQEQQCDSCVFDPLKDSSLGWAPATYRLMKSFRDGVPFVCHGGHTVHSDDGVALGRPKQCSEYLSVMSANPQEARRIAARTMLPLRKIVPVNVANRVRSSGLIL